MERRIKIYGTYFIDFYESQPQKVKDKIDYVLELVKYEERVPVKFLKHLSSTDGLYEIRVSASSKEIRIFSFFDEGRLIILTNCFLKKTQKTPKKELQLAKRLRSDYFANK